MFIVYALPRSRSFWLSRFLSYGGFRVSHDEAMHWRTLDDVQSWRSLPNTGTVETNAAPFWRLAKDVKTVILRRPIPDIVESVAKLLPVDRPSFTKQMERLDAKLSQIEHRLPNVLSLTFDDLATADGCKRVFEFCLPFAFDHEWWQQMAGMNLQRNLRHDVEYFQAYQPQLTKLAKAAKHRMLVDLNHRSTDRDDGLSLQEETFDQWYADAKPLFREHSTAVGEAPDSYLDKNYELIKRLYDLGSLQIMTARSNGRMFGYLVTILGPSLESPHIRTATHTTFYGSPDFPGVGMRLQRAALSALKAKGIHEVYYHAGVRGTGPRHGIIYRRLGADEFGTLYKLSL